MDIQAKMEELKAGPGSSKRLADFRTDQTKLVEDMDKVSTYFVLDLIYLIYSFPGRGEI